MPPYHSYGDVRRILNRTIANPKTRQFAAGYIEGHGERSGNNWKISQARLTEALRLLSQGKESNAPLGAQITERDISKIEEHLNAGPLGKANTFSSLRSTGKQPPQKVIPKSVTILPHTFKKAA
ncbi:hypothetical protein HY504_02180 [Candidatus Wolfebacteria bacterium]|nr:hypothetical protein [Candidatus Wolfebacteria bacterium]